jgi:hypothetical protein
MKSQTADSSGFSAFLGIDWSGAKAKSHAGLQLAHAMPGNGCHCGYRRLCQNIGHAGRFLIILLK